MVSKITIFEPHVEGVQIGPRSIGGDEPSDDESESEAEEAATEDGGRPIFRILASVAILSLVAFVGYRTLQDDDDAMAEVADPDEHTAEPHVSA